MREIEERAEQVLSAVPSWIWDGERLPVPVEDIADSSFGLLVRDVEDMAAAPGAPHLGIGASLSGLLLVSRGEIWVNAAEAREWPPRRRFTIGHEIGHWVMHRAAQRALFCRSTSVTEPTAPTPVGIEEEASVFAAALMMPAHLVAREHSRLGGDEAALCQVFGASRRALARRLADVLGPTERP